MASTAGHDGGKDQYDDIANAYSALHEPAQLEAFPLPLVEEAQVKAALVGEHSAVKIHGKSVLDLACGSGHYSEKFLAWGATSVTGVDISHGMLQTARDGAQLRRIPESSLKYIHGDVTDATLTIPGSPFDVVTGCWLLHYSSDTETMTKMFDTIARNLKPGGVFVGLTPPPLLNASDAEIELVNAAKQDSGAWGKYGLRGQVLRRLDHGDGVYARVELGIREKGQQVAVFETHYLVDSMYETACNNTGMFSGLEWRDYVVPDEVKTGRPVGFWNANTLMPGCRVCIARRLS